MGKKYSEGHPYKVIAFCLSCFSNDEQQRLIKKVVSECRKHSCKVVFFSTLTDFSYGDINDAGEKKIFQTISVECYDAIVLMAETFMQDEEQTALAKRAEEAGVPVIVVNKHMEYGIQVSFDYKGIFRKIVKHMVEEHGYRTINFMGGVPGISYAEDRLEAFKEVLAENGIMYEPERVFYGYFLEEPTQKAMQEMFESGLSLPEAIICANDNMAFSVCRFLQEKGYRVPEDIAVSGFDAVSFARYNSPSLTTGGSSMDECLHVIFDIIDGQEPEKWISREICISGEIQMGHSCGCPEPGNVYVIAELMKLREEFRKESRYQWDMNQMVANYGNAENLKDVIYAIPEYMKSLRYKDFWFCANENLVEDAELIQRRHSGKYIDEACTYTKVMNVLHYHYTEQETAVDFQQQIPFGELIPDRQRQFAENDYFLAVTVHMKGTTAGYAVISFDLDSFWSAQYASFITSFRYLLEMQKAQMKLMRVYMCDPLTNLYNRNGFYQKIQTVMQAAKNLDMSVISLDMDRLKKINDTYGHAEGDKALVALADIIRASTSGEIAARIGGDEFLIVFTGLDIGEHTDEIVCRIKQGIWDYNERNGKEYELHASIGAYTNRIGSHNLDFFLKKADDLMYARKYMHREKRGDI